MSKREKIAMFIGLKLAPRWLVRWCYIRVVAYATTGAFGATNVSELPAMDALKRWEDGYEQV